MIYKFNDTNEAVEELSIRTKKSKAAVVRDVLEIYKFLVNKVQAGDKLYSGRYPSYLNELVLPDLDK